MDHINLQSIGLNENTFDL